MAKNALTLPNSNLIDTYMHCALCLAELPKGESPRSYARLSVGFTPQGLQVWCVRHDCNVMHVHFEGRQHPANMTRKRVEAARVVHPVNDAGRQAS